MYRCTPLLFPMSVVTVVALAGCPRKSADQLTRPIGIASATPSAQPLAVAVTAPRCENGVLAAAPGTTGATHSAGGGATDNTSAAGAGLDLDGADIGTFKIEASDGKMGGVPQPEIPSWGCGNGVLAGLSPYCMKLRGQTLEVDGVSRDVAEKAVCGAYEKLRDCFSVLASSMPLVDGTLGLTLTVSEDGRAIAKVAGGTLTGEKLAACVEGIANQLAISSGTDKNANDVSVRYAFSVHLEAKPKE